MNELSPTGSIRIRDLSKPIWAAKSDWLPGTTYIGFTPKNGSLSARASCESTIQNQMKDGYVIEYVTRKFDEPNDGYENSARIIEEREHHAEVAGRLIAVHRIRHSARKLIQIVGEDEYEELQDMWAKPGQRHRWSVAFPIVESYDIVDPPLAETVFGTAAYRRVFAHSSAHLRPLNDHERTSISDLLLAPRTAPNAWIAIEDELKFAELSEIPEKLSSDIENDLSAGALEGESDERKAAYRKRAAWVANKFWMQRLKAGITGCDVCQFEPASRIDPAQFSVRSVMDVHHLNPLAEGVRRTTEEDFALLCPTCHRVEHLLLKKGLSLLKADSNDS